MVAHTLRLDYNALKKRMGAVWSRTGISRQPSFVELIGAAGAVGRRIRDRVREFTPAADAGAVEECGGAGLGGTAAGVARSRGMIQITPQMRVLVAIEPVDGRKGMDSLARLCQEKLAEDPFSGCVFIFRSRRGTTVRLLTYDGQGFWLLTKRLSKGRFRLVAGR